MNIVSRIVALFRRPAPPCGAPQYGALPYRIVDGEVHLLLVTSRGRGKWIFPKGGPIAGLTPWDSAAQEAYEEAGVEGEIEETPIGSYFLPITPERPRPVEVTVFPLRVTEERESWKEMRQRYRQWMGLSQAQSLIIDEGLADLALALARREAAKAS